MLAADNPIINKTVVDAREPALDAWGDVRVPAPGPRSRRAGRGRIIQ